MLSHVEPTEHYRTVGVDELFFSTTDRKGIIEQANTVFSRLSMYPREELMGAPHNIIRHPDMPGGAFKIMWDLLLSDQPMAAYVKNLAKDGYAYWVFATITPVGDQFLSVRTAPCARALWQTADSLYNEVLPIELSARNSGFTRAQAAELGAKELGQRVKALGFPSYDDFIRYALPEEITARISLSAQTAPRPDITGELGMLMSAVSLIDREIATLLNRLAAFQNLADALNTTAQSTRATIDQLTHASEMASVASETVFSTAPTLARSAQGMAGQSQQASHTLTSMAEQLQIVRHGLLDLRFRISLARLHNDMVRSFIIEVADGQAPPEGLSYVPMLAAALSEDIRTVATDMVRTNETLQTVGTAVDTAAELLRTFQRTMSTWRLLVPRYGLSRTLDPYVAPIDQQLNQGHSQMGQLRGIAAQCLDVARPFDPGPMGQAIDYIGAVNIAAY